MVLDLIRKQFSIETIVCGVCKTFGCVLHGFQLTHGTVCTKEIAHYRSNIDILVTVSLKIKLFTLIVMLIIGWNYVVYLSPAPRSPLKIGNTILLPV